MTLYSFYFLSFLAIFSALLVVFSKNPMYSVLYLVITFFAISGHYILLNAQFIAVVNIIVYAGAIMVLFLHVIMLLNLNQEAEAHKSKILKFIAAVCAGLFLLIFVGSLKGTELILRNTTDPGAIGLVKNLGKVLFDDFLLPFEIVSVLLLSAMVGAVMLGKSETPKTDKKS